MRFTARVTQVVSRCEPIAASARGLHGYTGNELEASHRQIRGAFGVPNEERFDLISEISLSPLYLRSIYRDRLATFHYIRDAIVLFAY